MELTVQAILTAAYPLYAAAHPVAGYARKALWYLLRCGTGELGTLVRRCPDGHFAEVQGRSCRHRACARCRYRRARVWLEGWLKRLLCTTHFHTVFTLPSELHEIWRTNRKRMAEILFTASRDTLLVLLADPAHLGALPGILMALHTWSRSLTLHPHVHCLVSAGGLTPDGVWKPITRDFLLPVAMMRKMFRGKLLGAVERSWRAGKLNLPPGWDAPRMEQTLKQAARKKWNIRIEPPYKHGQGVVAYLARYVCGGPLGDSRLKSFDNDEVTFVVGREQKDPATIMLSSAEFVRRILEHIPIPGLRMVRAYGLYASSRRAELALCRQQLPAPSSPSDPDADFFEQNLEIDCCPVCGKRLLVEGERLGHRGKPRSRDPAPPAPTSRAA
jgi:hypothetical protein